MKGLFIPEITTEMFRNGCLESIEALMADGEIYDIEYSRWIPVSERLPNKDRYIDFYKCLVAVSCTSRNDICDSFTAYFDGKHFYRHLYDRAIISGVKAWMPLPKPYDPQEREEQA